MDEETKRKVKDLVRNAIISKIDRYAAETEYKPFFQAIFSKEQILTHSIIHSFYTTFGTSIYEQIAKILALGAGYKSGTQYDLKGEIDGKTEGLIHNIDMELRRAGRKPDAIKEREEIRKSVNPGTLKDDPEQRVDFYLIKPDGKEYYFDITSVKPNKKEFIALKKKLLRWIGLRLSTDRNAEVFTAIALPYNPYHPKPYGRWTKGNMYDSNQLLVGEDFWNFVAGEKIYDEFLDIFKEVGVELREKIKDIAKR